MLLYLSGKHYTNFLGSHLADKDEALPDLDPPFIIASFIIALSYHHPRLLLPFSTIPRELLGGSNGEIRLREG